jgi:hypothetical protein
MEAAVSFKTLVSYCNATSCHSPEDLDFDSENVTLALQIKCQSRVVNIIQKYHCRLPV